MVDNKRETGAVVTQHSAEEVSFRSTRRTMNGCLFFAILALLPLKSATVCSPLCDEVTAVCVDDTDEPAHCICYFGYSTSNATNSTSCTAIDTFASAVTNDTPSTPAFSDGTKSIINYVQYVLTFWVIAWCLSTIVVCAVYRAWGHHRGIHLVEELTLIITYILIGCLAMNLAGQATACKIVSALTHYVFLCTMTAFVFEGLFAFSLVTGITPNNGYLPPILNYFLILLLPLIPFGASFGPLFAHYGTNGIHCWCDMSTAQVWAFFIPIIVVFFITGILAEATASDDYKLFQNTDLYQLNWSLKCDSSIMFLAGWTMFAYFIGLVAMDQQAVWVFVIFELFNLVLGPAVFVVHTMGHYQVAKPMHRKFPFLPFYKDTDPPDSVPNADKPKNKNIDPKPETEEQETDWQHFWSWVTNRNDRNIAQESEDVLFRKVPR